MFSFIKKEEKKNVCVQSCPCHPPVGTGSAVPMRYATFKAGCSPGRVTPRENERRGMWQPIGRCWVAAWARGSFQQHRELEERLKRGCEGRGHGKGVQHCFWKAFAFRLSTRVLCCAAPEARAVSPERDVLHPLAGLGWDKAVGAPRPWNSAAKPLLWGCLYSLAASPSPARSLTWPLPGRLQGPAWGREAAGLLHRAPGTTTDFTQI